MTSNNGEVYAAFLDLLGFKDLVSNNNHTKLERVYESFQLIIEQALAGGAVVPSVRDGREIVTPDLMQTKVHSLIISDSVLFWTDNASNRALVDILAVIWRLTSTSFFVGLPLRGAIALGHLTARFSQANAPTQVVTTTVFGEAFVRAYELQGQQEWAGAIVDPRCLARFDAIAQAATNGGASEIAKSDWLVKAGLLLPYKVPGKGTVSEEGKETTPEPSWVINWPRAAQSGVSAETVRKAFAMHGKRVDHAGVQAKIDHTLAFLAHASGRDRE